MAETMKMDFDALRADQARLNSQGNTDWKEKYVRMPEGEGSVTVRLLPWPGHSVWYTATRLHKIAGKNYHSPMVMERGKWVGNCPLNTEYRRLWQEIEKLERNGKMDAARDMRTLAGQIKPQERYYWNVIVRKETTESGDVKTDVGPKILSIGKDLQARIVNAMLGNPAMDDPGFGDVTLFDSGRDFRIRKKLKKGQSISYPEYSESSFLQPSSAGTQEQWKKWMETLHDLSAERKVKTNDELKEIIDIFMGRKEDPSLQVEYPGGSGKPLEVQKPVVQKVVTHTPTTTQTQIDDEEDAGEDFMNDLLRA